MEEVRGGEGRGGEEKRKTLAEDAYEINEYFLISCAWLVPGRKEKKSSDNKEINTEFEYLLRPKNTQVPEGMEG